MKSNIFFGLVSLAILEVCFSRVFDDKNDAIRDIDFKLQEVVEASKHILKAIDNEKKQITNVGEEELKKYLNLKANETRLELERDTEGYIRTAIVKAKPVAVIYCIRQVTFSGNNEIAAESLNNTKSLLEIKIKKVEKVGFDEYTINAIIKGIKDLAEQAKTKIRNGEGLLQTVKREAIANCESASLLLGEIEVCVHEPILSREYVKMRQSIDRSFKTIKTKFNSALENCLK